jgi:hypothetical protein
MGQTPFKDAWFHNHNVKALKKWLKKNDVNWRVRTATRARAGAACWRGASPS